MDHNSKIGVIGQLAFLDVVEHFQLQNAELDIQAIDDDAFKNEEEFFRLMAGSLNRLGQWALELHDNAAQILGEQNVDQIQAYHSIVQRIINRSLALVDTDKARIALPLMDFFSKFL